MTSHKTSRIEGPSHTKSQEAELIQLLHVDEAAKVLAISKRTLQQLTAERSVAHIKFGRNVRYDLSDLRRFAESRKIREIGWKAKQNPTHAQ